VLLDPNGWQTGAAPFGSPEARLKAGAGWEGSQKLVAKQSFQLERIPGQLCCRVFATAVDVDIFLNGRLVKRIVGQARNSELVHISDVILSIGANETLQVGANEMAVVCSSKNKNNFFDLGLMAFE
jgi:hypothetical protein